MGLALSQLRHGARALLGVILAVVLGVAFVTTTLLFGDVVERTARTAVAAQYDGADIVVSSQEVALGADTLATVAAVPGVATADGRQLYLPELSAGSRFAYPFVVALPTAPAIQDTLTLASGRLPSGPGEIALLRDVARQLEVETGDQVGTSYGGPGVPGTATVVGVIDLPASVGGTGAPEAYAWPADLAGVSDETRFTSILVTLAPGADSATVRSDISAAFDGAVTARTRDAQADAEIATISGDTDILTFGLVAFALVALFVAGLVIANTFAIIVAQRTRTLALMRCVGATRAQIRRSVLVEATVTGLAASALGMALGLGILIAGLRVVDATGGSELVGTEVPLSATALLLPVVVGTIVTIVAAWGPARGATAVSPLAALRPTGGGPLPARTSRGRLGLAGVLLTAGVVLLGAGAALSLQATTQLTVLVGILGGMLSFLGVVAGSVLVVPRVVRVIGQVAARVGGPAAMIAAVNSERNPRRTAATATALLVAVTLVTMMVVGTASTRSALDEAITERSPVDVQVSSDGTYDEATETYTYGTIPDAVPASLASNPDVAFSTPVLQADAEADGMPLALLGIDPDAARTLFRDGEQVAALATGTAIASEDWALNNGVADGDVLTLDGPGGDTSREVTVRVTAWDDYALLVARDDLLALDPDAPTGQIWLRLDDGADAGDAVGRIQDGLAGVTGIWFGGGAEERADNNDILDTVLLVVTALLGVAVAIALVGVGNTLSLSVIERTRESAILRALGLTRRQLRSMLAIEGVLLALTGALLGLLLGTAYGMIGAVTLLGDAIGISLAVPWDRLALIAVVAVAAGLLASVLPARAATRTSPVAALAE